MAEQLFATLHTNRGDIRIQLLPDHAPKTVRNFVELAEGGKEWTEPGHRADHQGPAATTARCSTG